jgi:hypothetical protein
MQESLPEDFLAGVINARIAPLNADIFAVSAMSPYFAVAVSITHNYFLLKKKCVLSPFPRQVESLARSTYRPKAALFLCEVHTPAAIAYAPVRAREGWIFSAAYPPSVLDW